MMFGYRARLLINVNGEEVDASFLMREVTDPDVAGRTGWFVLARDVAQVVDGVRGRMQERQAQEWSGDATIVGPEHVEAICDARLGKLLAYRVKLG